MIKIGIVTICLLLLHANYKRGQLISAASVWVACYFVVFVVCPCVNEGPYSNELLIDKIAFAGIVLFAFGLLIGRRVSIRSGEETAKKLSCLQPDFALSAIGFGLLFVLSILYIARTIGMSGVASVLNGSLTSKQLALGEEGGGTALLGWIQQFMVPCVLGMWFSRNNKKENRLAISCLALFSLEMALFSFTRIFFICTLLVVVMYEMRKKSARSQALISLAFIALVLVGMTALNVMRSNGLDDLDLKTVLDFDMILESTDFRYAYIYFDRILDVDSPYISPIVYLRFVFIFIPRSIWPDKPLTLNVQMMQYYRGTSDTAGSAGFSILGEAYGVLGFIGFFVYPVVWGLLCAGFDKGYFKRLNSGQSVSFRDYAFFMFCSFVLISAHRGDWGTYVVNIVWCYLAPMYLLCKLKIARSEIGAHSAQRGLGSGEKRQ
ncbi:MULTISPECIES: O-antigen polymerase [unclassified Adlercreutzia]|uniref:O-antigen polymerase n=1 Tax=unclassified Adlercreutzia TaxID=2636013 RepID=UPI0013EDFDE9|nr:MULTISPECIES: O-antigen polymerase [unclassified Adlercreutzia]